MILQFYRLHLVGRAWQTPSPCSNRRGRKIRKRWVQPSK